MDRVVENTIGLETSLRAAVLNNQPIDAEAADLIDSTSAQTLYGHLKATGLREELIHVPHYWEHLQAQLRHPASRHRHFGLCWILSRKRYGKKARPNPHQLLTALRCQWHRLLADLPCQTQLRLEHIFQVQLCPPMIRQDCLPLVAITFSTGKGEHILNQDIIPLDKVRAQWLLYSQEKDYLTSWLKDGDLEVDRSTFDLRLKHRNVWNFNLSPIRRGPVACLHLNQTATITAGIALHEAMEMAALRALPLPAEPLLPDLYVPAPGSTTYELDALVNKDEEVPWPLVRSTMAKLKAWWERGRNTNAVRRDFPCPARLRHNTNPHAWLDLFDEEDSSLPDVLYRPLPDWDAVLCVLGGHVWDLLYAVWLSDLIGTRGRVLYPLGYFTPGTRQDPVGKCRGELYAWFRPEHFGRDTYSQGVLQHQANLSSVQVLCPEG